MNSQNGQNGQSQKGDDTYENSLRKNKPSVSSHYLLYTKIRNISFVCLVFIVLRLQDAWILICNVAWELWCKILCLTARLITRQENIKLLCAYYNPHETFPQCTTLSKLLDCPIVVTPALHAYYAANKLLSHYTMQEWLLRFDMKVRFINLIFLRHGVIIRSRLDLDNDTETTTGKDADSDLATMPGTEFMSLRK